MTDDRPSLLQQVPENRRQIYSNAQHRQNPNAEWIRRTPKQLSMRLTEVIHKAKARTVVQEEASMSSSKQLDLSPMRSQSNPRKLRKQGSMAKLRRSLSSGCPDRNASKRSLAKKSQDTSPETAPETKKRTSLGKSKDKENELEVPATFEPKRSPSNTKQSRNFSTATYVSNLANERVAVFNANCEVGASFVRSLAKG
eukprot:7791028-Ditylum_brightwellii.AAC.1